MKTAINEKEYTYGIAPDIDMSGVVNTSYQIVDEIFSHQTVGYILRKVYHRGDGEKSYSLPFFFYSVDVVSKEEPEYKPDMHSFALRSEIFEQLKETNIPYINIFEPRFRIYYWISMADAISHGVNMRYKENDIYNQYILFPFIELDIVFDASSICPIYLNKEVNIDVSVIPTRNMEYTGRAKHVKEG